MILTYSLVCLIAATIGSLSGMGAGVIIKPIFDFLGFHDIAMINFLSVVAVFAMALSATVQQYRAKTQFDTRFIISIALGSILGGILGGKAFDLMLLTLGANLAKGIQALLLGSFILGVIVYLRGSFKSYTYQHPLIVFSIGLVLGGVASFLGVGGGPINVAFITFFFSMNLKETAIYSVAVILFAQGAKLITMYTGNQMASFDLQPLLFIVPTAIIGGILGAKLNHFFTEDHIKKIFIYTSYFLVVINFYNAYLCFFA
ncbi:MAG: sulfite exporter TauE/SafE family protein [Erysipelotrichaceae bacterium]